MNRPYSNMPFLSLLKKKIIEYPLHALLIFSALLRIGYALLNYPLWWDSHVYIGIGKYIFSNGQLGIWESFRPIIHPFLLGIFWKLHLNPFIIGKILDIIFSLLGIYLTYHLAKMLFNEKIALLSASIFSVTPLFIIFTGLILTEPLAIVLGLLGIILIVKQFQTFRMIHQHPWQLFFAGILLALSFLTKFPQGIWFGVIFCLLLVKPQPLLLKLKTLLPLTIGFFLPILPYLYLNYYLYHNPFEAFIQSSRIIETATWLYGSGISYYFIRLFIAFPIYIFFWYYLMLYFKENKEKNTPDEKDTHNGEKNILLLISICTFLYFLYLPRKEIRYLVTVLPFFAMMSSYAILRIYENLKKNTKPLVTPNAFIIILIIFIVLPLPTTLNFQRPPTFEKEINTIITLDGIEFAPTIYNREKQHYQLLFINDCDLACAPHDTSCNQTKQTLLTEISWENTLESRQTFKNCTYSIYLPQEK